MVFGLWQSRNYLREWRTVTSHDAQPDNLANDRAVSLLRASARVLLVQADALNHKPTRRLREDMRRVLAGVVADVECIRYALKE
jgi:hypothetical protein